MNGGAVWGPAEQSDGQTRDQNEEIWCRRPGHLKSVSWTTLWTENLGVELEVGAKG